MNCPVCHAGDRRPGTTTSTMSRGDATIVVRQVPADVCDNCGEAFLDLEIARELERIAETAFATGVRYELRDYIGKVA